MSIFSQAVIFNYVQLLRSNIDHINCLNLRQKISESTEWSL